MSYDLTLRLLLLPPLQFVLSLHLLLRRLLRQRRQLLLRRRTTSTMMVNARAMITKNAKAVNQRTILQQMMQISTTMKRPTQHPM